MHVLATLLLALVVTSVSALRTCDGSTRGNVYRAVDALERLAEFLSLHKNATTMDHALGVAIARGEIQAALQSLDSHLGHLQDVRMHRSALAARLVTVDGSLEEVLSDLQASTGPVPLLQPWLWRPVEPVGLSEAQTPVEVHAEGRFGQPEVLPEVLPLEGAQDRLPAKAVLELVELAGRGGPTEAESGLCIAALFGRAVPPASVASLASATTAGASPDGRCRIPPACTRAEAEGKAVGYAATHRVLFHHVARQLGCSRDDVSIGTWNAIARLCVGILKEAKQIARADFPTLLRDLFAEQVAVCGPQGFKAFAREDWLDRLLSWQRPAGCFGDAGAQREAAKPFLALRNNARLDDPLGTQCLSHLTGVAAAAVAFSARVLVDSVLAGGCSA